VGNITYSNSGEHQGRFGKVDTVRQDYYLWIDGVLSVILLSVILLSVILLSVILLSVMLLSVGGWGFGK
jgi:hypothetical protein